MAVCLELCRKFRAILGCVFFLCACISATSLARAQIVEQNPAPIVLGEQRSVPGSTELPADGDSSSIGVALRELVVVGEPGEAGQRPEWSRFGVDLSRAGPLMQDQKLLQRLRGLVGQPLSGKLLEEVRAAIVSYYRARGRPFVSATFPPQEVTGGTLEVRVVEFSAGKIVVEGNQWTPEDYILKHVRLKPGEKIDAKRLVQDVNWLNLNPYRSLGAVFEPGVAAGETNVTLRSEDRRPWTVYAGYANSGTTSTGLDRVFAGANVANLPFLDHQLSYLATLNPETLTYGEPVNVSHAPGYVSHALSYFAPIDVAGAVRTKFQLTAGYVESGSVLNRFFDEFSQSWAITGEFAFPIAAPGTRSFDVFAGADFKRQFSETVFGDTVIAKTNTDVAQLRLGVRGSYGFSNGPIVSNGFAEGYAVLSPSSVLSSSSDYSYLRGAFEHTARYGQGIGATVSVTGQYAPDELPDLEKTAIGGASTVRGYSTNALSGSSGVSGRFELLSPQFSYDLLDGLPLSAEAYGFFDAGYVWNENSGEEGIQSIGAGVDIALGNHISATAELGHALRTTAETNSGETSLIGTFVVRY